MSSFWLSSLISFLCAGIPISRPLYSLPRLQRQSVVMRTPTNEPSLLGSQPTLFNIPLSTEYSFHRHLKLIPSPQTNIWHHCSPTAQVRTLGNVLGFSLCLMPISELVFPHAHAPFTRTGPESGLRASQLSPPVHSPHCKHRSSKMQM